ncbi:hypothetical protein EMIT0P171_120163 [Pseudomonas sp. IT-P171]
MEHGYQHSFQSEAYLLSLGLAQYFSVRYYI